ncbi:MAG: ribonuclease HII [Chlorobiales bacterium]|nr:ribonuclease HII [Chlorobiales bacterium]
MNTDYEWPLWRTTRKICGIDEVGRGPLAGPVVAGAVVFPRWFRPDDGFLEQLNDSKKLSAKMREELVPEIKKYALGWAVASVEPDMIDRINILQATMLAMNNAVESLPVLPELLLVDGNRFKTSLGIPYTTLVKGDSKVFSIAAASVLAKTHRDEIMAAYSTEWPEYGFDRHVGYGTKEHVRAIIQYGRCPIHRTSFKLKQLGEK